MITSITKMFTFEAAHQLPKHKGKCARLHGHSYRLEVTVTGPIINDGSSSDGMIMDFGDMGKIVDEQVIQQWDHQFLNDLLPFTTTAELLANEIFARLTNAGLPICRVRLWETQKAFVTIGI